MRLTLCALAVAGIALSASAVGKDDFRIYINPTNIIKDIRDSSCAPNLGYAGGVGEAGLGTDAYLAAVRHPEKTARIYREAGVWLLRSCSMFDRFRKIAAHGGKDWELDKDGKCAWLSPKVDFEFYRRYGIKVIVCIGAFSAKYGDDVEAFAKWISDNGWADLVAGFEMCNEPFYGNDPEGFAQVWKGFLPRIRRHLPKAKIGLPLAEYCPGDPDIAVAKARLLGEGKLGGDYFSANNLNRWSAKVVEAMGDDLTNVSHIIYHVYGGNSVYGCSNSGFTRFRRFAKMFPQVADKRWWITEWRERSDENLTCQRQFRMVLWKGMYAQTALCQPELDGFTLHELASLSGAFYVQMHGKWNQYFADWKNADDVQWTGPDDVRYEVGGTGALFALYAQALKTHPLVVDCWSMNHKSRQGVFWACSQYYDNPGKNTDCQWTALFSKSRGSLCLLLANTTADELRVPVAVYGYRLGSKTYRYLTCEERYLDSREVPGEVKPWKRLAWEDGRDLNDPVTPNIVVIPPRSVGTVMIEMRVRSDRWGTYAGEQLLKKKVLKEHPEAKVEMCAVHRGDLYMDLPPKTKSGADSEAHRLCARMFKDGKLDAKALDAAKASGYEVFVNDKKSRVFLYRAAGLPADDKSRDRFAEMAGF